MKKYIRSYENPEASESIDLSTTVAEISDTILNAAKDGYSVKVIINGETVYYIPSNRV